MDMKLKVAEYIAAAAKCCFENCGLGCEDICAMIETPPDKKMGDYALPCFRLSKVMRCAPQMIAGKLAEKVACEEIDHVEVVFNYFWRNAPENECYTRAYRVKAMLDEAGARYRGVGARPSGALGFQRDRQGQDGVLGLFLHQHRQALPHRPPVHDDDRQQPQAHL